MALPTDCAQNTDSLKLVREGTSQKGRSSPALDPAYAPVNERTPAHGLVFAQAYSAFLKYYNSNNAVAGDWTPFFSNDVSGQLAIAAVQDIEYYKSNVRIDFDFLNNINNKNADSELKNSLGYLFSFAATLAQQLDVLKEGLPNEIPLKGALQNLIQSQLAPSFKSLFLYYRDGLSPNPLPPPNPPYHSDVQSRINVMGATTTFKEVKDKGLSKDWITGDDATNWTDYALHLENPLKYESTKIYGSGATVFERVNHIATHNLFSSIFDQFLKVYARTASDAKQALEATFKKWDRHEPHYALFLAYLRLFEYVRDETNTLSGRHLDLYYREILRLKQKPAEPAHAHLLLELSKPSPTHFLAAGELFKAGKDDLGKDVSFSNDRDFIANQTKVASLKTVYRHGDEKVGIRPPTEIHLGRLYASPNANSDDGLGADLISVDQSWHPFHNKRYEDGMLSEIKMPKAEVGFAIASYYLLMSEGTRTVTLDFTVTSGFSGLASDRKEDVVCLFTSEKGWIEKTASKFVTESGLIKLAVALSGADPAITPYSATTHGYSLSTNLPVLLVKLRNRDAAKYLYSEIQNVVIQKIDLKVDVQGLKSLAISNDFGPVDTSKPFQPYGASPVAGNALIIGSKEVFQKKVISASVAVTWLTAPTPYPTSRSVNVYIDSLEAGQWVTPTSTEYGVGASTFNFTNNPPSSVVDVPDLTANEFYNTTSRHGFARLRLNNSFGQDTFQSDLLKYLRSKDSTINPVSSSVGQSLISVAQEINTQTDSSLSIRVDTGPTDPRPPPVGPSMSAISVNYSASQSITLNSFDADAFKARNARFFHLFPFGQAEQHPALNSSKTVHLLPRFEFKHDNEKEESEAEFYIGLAGLKPPQNLALLFQAAEGTADPLSKKPEPHIHWSYLQSNKWIAFEKNDVEDHTGGLLNSGIITFAMPRDASDGNTILPTGMHWIRAAVASKSDAVCRLLMVSAQALEAKFVDQGNDPVFPGKVLAAGTISKLDQPDAEVKKITQPFASFGGRGAELPAAFYTRISERLRHKDRAISLWDHERLILEAFPEVYQVKCLNHTHYERNESGSGIYKELSPGHVTIVTIPSQQFQNLNNPLRPYTSLGLLQKIDAWLRKRHSCFVKLHVRNPQFEEVRVNFNVRLYEGFDETFYKRKLKEDITRFLSPWAFPGGGSASFGGKIYKSLLIKFVEDQPSVDYVTDFQLFHDVDGVLGTTDTTEVEGSKAVSILVSAPAHQHHIEVINPATDEELGETCPCEA